MSTRGSARPLSGIPRLYQCVLHAAGGAVLSAATGKPFRYNRRETLLNGDFIALGDTSLPWRDWLSD